MQLHDPELLDVLKKHRTKPQENATKFKKHAKGNWEFNMAIIDVD